MQITALHNNDVILISSASAVPDDVKNDRIRSAVMQDFETSELLLFQQRFMAWEQRTIIERQNSERFLILKRFMEIEGLEWVLFVDSELALLTKASLQSLEPGFDTMLSSIYNGKLTGRPIKSHASSLSFRSTKTTQSPATFHYMSDGFIRCNHTRPRARARIRAADLAQRATICKIN
jgi:hypothetical protein